MSPATTRALLVAALLAPAFGAHAQTEATEPPDATLQAGAAPAAETPAAAGEVTAPALVQTGPADAPAATVPTEIPPEPNQPAPAAPVSEPPATEGVPAGAPPAPANDPVTQLQDATPATVTFTSINDAVPDRFFDAATTAPAANDPSTLVIGLSSGMDSTIWKEREFKASLLPFSYASATDTISFVIHAPKGSYVSGVRYLEKLAQFSSRLGRSFAVTQLVVNGIATEHNVVDLSKACATVVPMSVTTSLVAASTEVELEAGSVAVEVASVLPGCPAP